MTFDRWYTCGFVECKPDAVEPPAGEVVEQHDELLEAISTELAAQTTIVEQSAHELRPAAEPPSQEVVAPSVEKPVKLPPGELLAADTAQQAAAIGVELSVGLTEMLGLQSASAESIEHGANAPSVDHHEWTTRLPARRYDV